MRLLYCPRCYSLVNVSNNVWSWCKCGKVNGATENGVTKYRGDALRLSSELGLGVLSTKNLEEITFKVLRGSVAGWLKLRR